MGTLYPSKTLLVIHDDPAIQKWVAHEFRADDLWLEFFESAEAFFDAAPKFARPARCMLIRVTLPGMDGITCMKEMHRRGMTIPVIFYARGPKIKAAVEALREGAIDFFEEPSPIEELRAAVNRSFSLDHMTWQRHQSSRDFATRMGRLSKRERQVLDLVEFGKSSKEISSMLEIGVQTVLKHKARVLNKFNVRNDVELVQLLNQERLSRERLASANPAQS